MALAWVTTILLDTSTLQLDNGNAVQNSTVVDGNNKLTFGSGLGTFNLGGLMGNAPIELADTANTAVNEYVDFEDVTIKQGYFRISTAARSLWACSLPELPTQSGPPISQYSPNQISRCLIVAWFYVDGLLLALLQ